MTKTKLTLCTLAAMFAAGQAFAHTGVRDKVTVSSAAGAASYNGFTITHGCGGDSGDAYPVIGQSAVFPTGDRVVWREGAASPTNPNSNIIAFGGGAGIFDTVVIDHSGTPLPDTGLDLQVTGYSSANSAFTTAHELVDSDPTSLTPGRVEGLLWKDGAMEPKLNTVTEFKVTVPKIINPAIKQVNVRIGVINYCDTNKNANNDNQGPWKAPKDAYGRAIPILATAAAPDQINVANATLYSTLAAGNGDNNRQDWWFSKPFGGSLLYNDPEVLQPTYWTTMTVINASATGNRVVSIEPTGEAFDAILTGPNTRPFTKGVKNL